MEIDTLRYRTVRLVDEVQRAHERAISDRRYAIVSADGIIATAKGANATEITGITRAQEETIWKLIKSLR